MLELPANIILLALFAQLHFAMSTKFLAPPPSLTKSLDPLLSLQQKPLLALVKLKFTQFIHKCDIKNIDIFSQTVFEFSVTINFFYGNHIFTTLKTLTLSSLSDLDRNI